MHISALEEYGLRCALQLARRYSEGHVPASQIASKEGVSTEYVSKLMFLFRKAGLITASRGIQGGFMLARAPGEVTLKEVLDAVATGKSAGPEFCSNFSGKQEECVHIGGCSVRPVWNLISSYFHLVLRDLTLADLTTQETDVSQKVEEIARKRSEQITSKFKADAAESTKATRTSTVESVKAEV